LRVAEKCDPCREVQTRLEDRDLVTFRHDDVFAIPGSNNAVLSVQSGFATVAPVDSPGANNNAHVAADARRVALYIIPAHFIFPLRDHYDKGHAIPHAPARGQMGRKGLL
jgi:hypothetical protein